MAYIVISNNNRQSYTLRNTANKPRVVLKSNGTSYIPLKAGTDTRATRLAFNINGNHYKAGGETSTTSIQSNTTYTYFGAQTYRTSTYHTTSTNGGYVYESISTLWWYYDKATSTTATTVYYADYNSTVLDRSSSTTIPAKADMTYSQRVYNGPYSPEYTSYITAQSPVSIRYGYRITINPWSSKSSITSTTVQNGLYAPVINTTRSTGYYTVQIIGEFLITGSANSYYTASSGTTTKKSSYDYGYNVEVGNTTTSVQTTTEV